MQAQLYGRMSRADFAGLPYEHVAHDPDTGLRTETFAQAVARIGATKTTLLIDEDLTVAGAVTIPSTLKLKWTNRARLVDGGGTITFSGNPFVDGQHMGTTPLFEGFSADDINFTGDTPKDISTAIVYNASDSLTQRLARLTEWFEAGRLTFHCFPSTITEAVTINDGHSLYFRAGEFDNVHANGGILGTAAFTMGAYSKFHSEQGALVYESSVAGNPQIVRTAVDCRDCIIETTHFVDNDGAGDSASANVTIGGGSYNCHVRNNWFDGISGYHVGIAQTAGQDPPEWCSINENYFTGFLTQLAFITSGKHCEINRNRFNLKDVQGFSAFSLIDVEPNFAEEAIEDLDICDNIIDTRGVSQIGTGNPLYHSAIILQGVNTVGLRRIRVLGNHILGDGVTMQTAISGNGVVDLEIAGNYVTGAGNWWAFEQCNGVKIHDNIHNDTTGANIFLTSTANARVWNNMPKGPVVVTEAEKYHLAGGNGSDTINLGHSYSNANDGRIYESYEGLIVTFQDTDYTVDEVNTTDRFQSLTVTVGSPPASGQRVFNPAAINVADNRINIPAHGYSADKPLIWGSWGSVPGGLANDATYYAIVVDANNIRLAAAPGGAAIDITSQGSDMHEVAPIFFPANVNAGTDTINMVGHQLNDLALVEYFGATPIGGLTVGQRYFVIKIDDDNFKLALSRADAVADTAIDLTSQGVGLQYALPVMATKFSNNKYRNNDFTTYNLAGTSANNGGF